MSASAALQAPAEAGGPSDRPRIAVGLVDDHLMVRQGFGSWLLAEGDDIDVVGSAGTVAELLEPAIATAQVVLLDVRLGDGSALEANIHALTERGARVVVVSADRDPATAHRAVTAGALSYLPKEVSAAELLTAIRTVASGGTYMSQDLATALISHQPVVRPKLSPQEVRVLRMYAAGMALKSVALRLELGDGTVKTYVDRIREKYQRAGRDASTRVDLYRRAAEDGYLDG